MAIFDLIIRSGTVATASDTFQSAATVVRDGVLVGQRAHGQHTKRARSEYARPSGNQITLFNSSRTVGWLMADSIGPADHDRGRHYILVTRSGPCPDRDASRSNDVQCRLAA